MHSTPHCAFLLFQLLVLRLLILCRRFSAIGRPRKAHDPCHKLRNLPVTAAAADIISRPTRRQRPRHHALRRFAACERRARGARQRSSARSALPSTSSRSSATLRS